MEFWGLKFSARSNVNTAPSEPLFRVLKLGFRVCELGLRVVCQQECECCPAFAAVKGLGFRDWGFGVRA